MREFVGVLLATLDERRHEVAMFVAVLFCSAAVWAMLLAWTQ